MQDVAVLEHEGGQAAEGWSFINLAISITGELKQNYAGQRRCEYTIQGLMRLEVSNGNQKR
jgi:hypothetical protein